MRESKAELTDRLRREGRWDAFKKLREKLKVEGTDAADAWQIAAAEFPPPDDRPTNGKAPKPDLSALKGKPAVAIVEAAGWAFEHLDTDWVTPAEAPSAGAWSILHWARSNAATRSEFYRLFVVKMVLPVQEEARQTKLEADTRDREIEERLASYLEKPDPEAERAEEERRVRELQEQLKKWTEGLGN